MAAPQNITARVEHTMLYFHWEILGEPVAMCIQVAYDVEFTKNVRTFFIPTTSGLGLDMGAGAWYFRVGSLIGTKHNGKIVWSPIHGPAIITVSKLPVVAKTSTIPILHSRPIVQGIRIHIGVIEHLYAILEYSKDNKFPASQTSSLYSFDFGRGYFDITDLDPTHTYNARIATFTQNRGQLPTDSIVQLENFQAVYGKKPTRVAKPLDSTNRSESRAGETILREMREKPHARFASHADYVRYIATKAKYEER